MAAPERRRDRDDAYWLFGLHAGLAALANPARSVRRIVTTPAFLERHAEAFGTALAQREAGDDIPREAWPRARIERLLGPNAVHQGLALEVDQLVPPDIHELASDLAARESAMVLLLDRVTDPQNVGAIMRSAAAFGVVAVVSTWRHAPPETGALAKAATGALERVAYLRETNLARAIETLRAEAALAITGLDAGATSVLGQGTAVLAPRLGLVVGAEGPGLRPSTRDACDDLRAIPITLESGSLNVSVATAIALYDWRRARGDGGQSAEPGP